MATKQLDYSSIEGAELFDTTDSYSDGEQIWAARSDWFVRMWGYVMKEVDQGSTVAPGSNNHLMFVDTADDRVTVRSSAGYEKLAYTKSFSANNYIVFSNADKKLEEISNLTAWIGGGTGIDSVDDGDGSITLSVDLNEVPTDGSVNPTDYIPIVDSVDNLTKKVLHSTLESSIDHDALAGFVPNEHLDWTVSIANEIHLDNIPSLPAGQVTSGTFADARISQSSVTQHEAALTITESQITDGSILARLAANETVTGLWDFEGAILGLNATVAFEARSSLPQYRWRETDGAADEKQYAAYVEGGILKFETQSDASVAGDTFMKVTRTGTDVDPVDFPAGVRQTHNHIFEAF